MENLREALSYIADLGVAAEKTEVLEISGKTYANKSLTRYDDPPMADAIKASTLTSLIEYIKSCSKEFTGNMLIHIKGPKEVCFMSELNKERSRETLFAATAETSEYNFGSWYDQERFMIELQANFVDNPDLQAVLRLAGNVEKKNNQTFSDDGRTQVATMSVGVASKADVIVPNPVELIPYRTFQEVAQPSSKFVFRIGDKSEPAFMLVEAEGGLWKNEAISNIKQYLTEQLQQMEKPIKERITIIG